MKKLLNCFSMCLLLGTSNSFTSNGQPEYLNLLSPQTYDFVKYGNTPVNHFTGETNVQIPVYAYKDKDFEIPIFLGYNSSGFIPNKREGIVGLDWYLNAGGVITRRVNGQPDDRSGKLPYSSSDFIPHGLLYGIKNNLAFKSKSKDDVYNFNLPWALSPSGYWNINECEVEPDDFTFSAPGFNGRFIIQHNGEVHCIGNKPYKVDLNGMAIQPYEASYVNNSEIVITTDDGFKYFFGGSIQNLEVSYTITLTDSHVINAWHLTKIISPTGRQVTFNYMPFTQGFKSNGDPNDLSHYLFNFYYNFYSTYNCELRDWGSGELRSYSSSGPEEPTKEVTKTVYLQSINIDQSPISIEFDYVEKPNKFYTDENSLFNQKTKEIKNIYVKYGTETVKTFTLTYGDFGPLNQTRRFLTSFQESGVSAYRFDYWSTSLLPPPKSTNIDYWGFRNDKTYSASYSLIPSTNYSQFGDIVYTGDRREPTTINNNVGLLKKVTYPTGGSTTYEYEGHTYSRRLERRSDHQFIPFLYQVSGVAGGARIKRIIDNDGTADVNIREFKYFKDYPLQESTSGILMDWPRYVFYWEYLNGPTQYGSYLAKCTGFNSNYYPGENYIHYKEVTEISMPSNGYTNYKFTNYEDNKDEQNYNKVVLSQDYQDFLNHITNADLRNLYNSIVGIKIIDRSFERGIAKVVSVYANQNGTFIPIRKLTVQQFTDKRGYLNNYLVGILQTGALAQSYKIDYYPCLPKVVEEISYGTDGSAVTVTKSFAYNSSNQITQESYTNSDNKTDSIIRKYPTEYSGNTGPLQKMRDMNMINAVIEEQKWIDSKITTATFNKYSNFGINGDIPLLKDVYQLETINPLANNEFIGLNANGELQTGTQYKLNTTLDYDNNNLTLILWQKTNDMPITYIWGYNNLQPVIKAKNATNSALNGALTSALSTAGYSSLDNLLSYIGDLSTANQQSKWTTFNVSLRNNSGLSNSLITTYTFRPLRGINSETDPIGNTNLYFYDGNARLQYLKDKDLNIIQEYLYHYKQ